MKRKSYGSNAFSKSGSASTLSATVVPLGVDAADVSVVGVALGPVRLPVAE